MGSGHSHASTGHSEPTPEAMAARRKANRILAAVLIPLTLLTLAGMAMLWPSGSKDGISLANPYSAEVLRALEDSARDHDVLIFAGSVDGDVDREVELVRAFSSRRADALLLVPSSAHQDYLTRELEPGTPVVFVDRPPIGPSFSAGP